MIPKIIHYCWFGKNPLPEKYEVFIEGWRKIMPEYELMLWNEDNSPMDNKYLKKAQNNQKWANLSNFVRLYAVEKFGGIYLDTDVEVVKSFDDLLQQHCFFGYQLPDGSSANNAIFGAEPNHTFIQLMLEAIQILYDGTETEYLSSPHLTSFLLKSNGYLEQDSHSKDNEVTVLPYDFFYPYSWLEKYDAKCITPNTYTLHHWAASWADAPKKKYGNSLIKKLFR